MRPTAYSVTIGIDTADLSAHYIIESILEEMKSYWTLAIKPIHTIRLYYERLV